MGRLLRIILLFWVLVPPVALVVAAAVAVAVGYLWPSPTSQAGTPPAADSEAAVIVEVAGNELSSSLPELRYRVSEAIEGIGALDGDEIAVDGASATLSMHGRSWQALFAAVSPVLRASPLTHFEIRQAPPGAPNRTVHPDR